MNLRWTGMILAIATFATIGMGHILVRRLHARFGTRPGIPFFLAGGFLLVSSLLVSDNLLSGVLGITGITLTWDGLEFYRQEKRVLRDREMLKYDSS